MERPGLYRSVRSLGANSGMTRAIVTRTDGRKFYVAGRKLRYKGEKIEAQEQGALYCSWKTRSERKVRYLAISRQLAASEKAGRK